MARHRKLKIEFPLGGLNRQRSYRQQRPYTTVDCLNVRPVGTIEGRRRGGSRPGLTEVYGAGLSYPVRMLSPMTLALGDGFTTWSDTFGGLSLAAAWTQASWASAEPGILQPALAGVDTDIAEAAVVRDALPIDTAEAYSVEMLIVPWSGAFHGKYRLYLRMDDTTPAYATDGIEIELCLTGSAGAYSGTLKSYASSVESSYDLSSGSHGSAEPGWLRVQVSSNTITVYWRGTQLISQTVSAHTGKRIGFGMECTVDGGVCLTNTVRALYYSISPVDSLRTQLIASANGNLYKESYLQLEEVSTSLSLRDDVPLSAVQSGQKLYIADYGDVRATGTDGSTSGTSFDATGVADWTALGISTHDDVVVISNPQGTAVAGTYKIASVAAGNLTLASSAGTGACAYRIERAPKVYDPSDDSLAILVATEGQVPTGCPLMCRYNDRIVVGGAQIAPHVWYMSRRSDETDWDYSQTDSERAVAGTSSDAGVPGSPLTSLIPHSDDYLIMGCRNEMWRLRGDPTYGGVLDSLSYTIGIIGAQAWCFGPAGELIFLSMNGLYSLAAGGDSSPIQLSGEVLPQEFRNINPDETTVSLEYDTIDRGVHIFLTPDSSNTRVHWWFDWTDKTFWPVTLDSDHEPTATCAMQSTVIEESGVIVGGRDGILRRFSGLAESDCGEAFSSYVLMGPLPLAEDGAVGTLMSMDVTLAKDSADVTWEVQSANTYEATMSASAISTGDCEAGLNATVRPAARGQAMAIKFTGESRRKWAMEKIIARTKQAGKLRVS